MVSLSKIFFHENVKQIETEQNRTYFLQVDTSATGYV